jgi:hypothetical protein
MARIRMMGIHGFACRLFGHRWMPAGPYQKFCQRCDKQVTFLYSKAGLRVRVAAPGHEHGVTPPARR